ncbi:hypothetical protein LEMLEM_LOCUS18317 [Lemmus lemmus]
MSKRSQRPPTFLHLLSQLSQPPTAADISWEHTS